MDVVRVELSALWVARMLAGLLGDVLRFLEPGMMDRLAAGGPGGVPLSHGLLLGSAVVMTFPIVMVVLSLTLPYTVCRWANIVVAACFFALDGVGLPTYTSGYSIFLILVGLAFNVLTVWYAWRWRAAPVE